MLKKVRRGRATEAIFDLTIVARHSYRSIDSSAPSAPTVETVPASVVARAFRDNKKLIMVQARPGFFVISLPNQGAFESYELFTR